MKYSEFEIKVKEIDELLKVEYIDRNLFITDDLGEWLVNVGRSTTHSLHMVHPAIDQTSEMVQAKLYALSWALATTPLDERE